MWYIPEPGLTLCILGEDMSHLSRFQKIELQPLPNNPHHWDTLCETYVKTCTGIENILLIEFSFSENS